LNFASSLFLMLYRVEKNLTRDFTSEVAARGSPKKNMYDIRQLLF
jgi:hypothetical protein